LSPKALIIDANLLTLFIIGATNKKYISKHKRSKQYTQRDYETLEAMLIAASGIITTPHTLAETSNLVKQFGNLSGDAAYEVLMNLFRFIKTAAEKYVPSQNAAERTELFFLGLSDLIILEACSDNVAVITADEPLYNAAVANGKTAFLLVGSNG
jgi:hypothetical protein